MTAGPQETQRASSRWQRAIADLRCRAILGARAVWRGAWNLLPVPVHPLRIRIASAARIVIGVPRPGSRRRVGDAGYSRWIARNDTLTANDRRDIRAHIAWLPARPVISVAMRVQDTPVDHLRGAIASVRAQLYPHWELCIVDDASGAADVTALLASEAAEDPRIRVARNLSPAGPTAAANAAIDTARGTFVVLMAPEDRLAEHALYEIAAELARFPDAAVIYSDEDGIDGRGERCSPCFKPDFDPDLLLGRNLVRHIAAYRRDLIDRVGGLRDGFEGSHDHDLALRATAECGAARVRHVPAVLYHARLPAAADEARRSAGRRAAEGSRRAVADSLAARGVSARLDWVELAPETLRVMWPVPQPAPLVSVIVPTRDRADMLGECADGVLNRTDYKALEFLVVDNGSTEAETFALFDRLRRDTRVRVIAAPGPFNFSALNNRAVAEARGSVLVLLNNDTSVIDPAWLHEMVAQAVRPDVGAVGAKLSYPDGTLQHGGVVVGAGGVAGHYALGAAGDDPGAMASLALVRQVTAVTAACLAVRTEVFREAGGFDEEGLAVAFNDVDFCLRVAACGYRNLWTPFARLHHRESVSRGVDFDGEKAARFAREVALMRQRWGTATFVDPFFNPNLDLSEPDGTLAPVTLRTRPWLAAREWRSRAA